ncbi:MAG: hypothetical protein VCD00_12335 [Candidatus Hydrogenedentota bacterium]
MQLTSEQKSRIAEYLQEQDGGFVLLGANARVQALAMVKTRIRIELFALKQDVVSDEQVESILSRMTVSVKPKIEAVSAEEKVPVSNAPETIDESQAESEPEVVEVPKVEPTDSSLQVERRVWETGSPEPVDEETEAKDDVVEASTSVEKAECPESATLPEPIRVTEPRDAPESVKVEPSKEPVRVVEPVVNKPVVNKPVVNKPVVNKPVVNKPVAIEPEPEEVEATIEEDAKPKISEVSVSVATTEEEDFGDRHWLGVCAAVSSRMGWSTLSMRIGFIALGCATGPFALILYLFCFSVDVQRHPDDYPAADGRVASWRLVRALTIALALYAGAWLILFVAGWVFTQYLGRIAQLNQLGWFMANDRLLLNFALLSILPMAMLSGFPLARQWDRTMSLLVNTGLALYAVVLGIAVSSALAGYFVAALG